MVPGITAKALATKIAFGCFAEDQHCPTFQANGASEFRLCSSEGSGNSAFVRTPYKEIEILLAQLVQACSLDNFWLLVSKHCNYEGSANTVQSKEN